jgi:hypothetical protein
MLLLGTLGKAPQDQLIESLLAVGISAPGKTVSVSVISIEVTDDFAMRLGGHWVQTHGKSFILLAGNKVDFGAKELSCLWQ